uniref:Uncharacterized protein n=1 Tax=Amphimedon queenslandica TaxID=400682 RepID=A0A1X7SL78_AMPQE
ELGMALVLLFLIFEIFFRFF